MRIFKKTSSIILSFVLVLASIGSIPVVSATTVEDAHLNFISVDWDPDLFELDNNLSFRIGVRADLATAAELTRDTQGNLDGGYLRMRGANMILQPAPTAFEVDVVNSCGVAAPTLGNYTLLGFALGAPFNISAQPLLSTDAVDKRVNFFAVSFPDINNPVSIGNPTPFSQTQRESAFNATDADGKFIIHDDPTIDEADNDAPDILIQDILTPLNCREEPPASGEFVCDADPIYFDPTVRLVAGGSNPIVANPRVGIAGSGRTVQLRFETDSIETDAYAITHESGPGIATPQALQSAIGGIAVPLSSGGSNIFSIDNINTNSILPGTNYTTGPTADQFSITVANCPELLPITVATEAAALPPPTFTATTTTPTFQEATANFTIDAAQTNSAAAGAITSYDWSLRPDGGDATTQLAGGTGATTVAADANGDANILIPSATLAVGEFDVIVTAQPSGVVSAPVNITVTAAPIIPVDITPTTPSNTILQGFTVPLDLTGTFSDATARTFFKINNLAALTAAGITVTGVTGAYTVPTAVNITSTTVGGPVTLIYQAAESDTAGTENETTATNISITTTDGDVNGDGRVSVADAVIKAQWLNNPPAAGATFQSALITTVEAAANTILSAIDVAYRNLTDPTALPTDVTNPILRIIRGLIFADI